MVEYVEVVAVDNTVISESEHDIIESHLATQGIIRYTMARMIKILVRKTLPIYSQL